RYRKRRPRKSPNCILRNLDFLSRAKVHGGIDLRDPGGGRHLPRPCVMGPERLRRESRITARVTATDTLFVGLGRDDLIETRQPIDFRRDHGANLEIRTRPETFRHLHLERFHVRSRPDETHNAIRTHVFNPKEFSRIRPRFQYVPSERSSEGDRTHCVIVTDGAGPLAIDEDLYNGVDAACTVQVVARDADHRCTSDCRDLYKLAWPQPSTPGSMHSNELRVEAT